MVDEPLYGFYLSESGASEFHPGAEEIIASQNTNGAEVIRTMLEENEKPIAFFKHMTHHLLDLDRSFLTEVQNVILTRDPVEMLPSFAKVIDNPTMKDVGYQDHLDLVNELESRGIKPLVIDSKDLLMNPKAELIRICNALEIPFDELMLSWEEGARPEDGVWAEYWYSSVHKSGGFSEYKKKTDPFPEELEPLLNECIPIYNQLLALSSEN